MKKNIIFGLFLLNSITFAGIQWQTSSIAISARHSKETRVDLKKFLRKNCSGLRMVAHRPYPAFIRFSLNGDLMKINPLASDAGEHSFAVSASCADGSSASAYFDIHVE